jgi:hypothetical protein
MRRVLFPLLLVSLPLAAQDQAIQRELIQRQQQSEAFNLQLQQSLRRSAVPQGDHLKRMELDTGHLGQRQDLENFSGRQLLDVKADTPQELRPYERTKAQQERLIFSAPVIRVAPMEVPVKPVAPPTLTECGGLNAVVPAAGIEPATFGLQNRCSTN